MTTAEKSTRMGFDMEGAWFADFCRTRLQEGDWEIALRNLTECIGGLSTDQAISILKGEATFTGWASDEDGIKLVNVEKTDPIYINMQKIYKRMYGNTFRHGDRYYKPYAYVVGPWVKEDYDYMFNVGKNGTSSTFKIVGNDTMKARAEQGLIRSMYYANKPNEDLMVVVHHGVMGHTEVLCEVTRTPPFWIQMSNNDPVGFLKQKCEEGLVLEGRGAYIPESPAEKTKMKHPEVVIADKPSAEDRAQTIIDTAIELITKTRDILSKADTATDIAFLEKDYNDLFASLHAAGKLTDEIWTEHDEINASFEDLKVQRIRKGVIEQAEKTCGFYTMNLKRRDDSSYSPVFVKVPKNPFIRWCLRHFDYEAAGKTPPEWQNLAYSGFKMMGDDPNHTDWFIATGAPMEEAYSHNDDTFGDAIVRAAHELREEVLKEWTNQDFSVLSRGDKKNVNFHGRVIFPKPGDSVPEGSVCVIPHAGPEYHSLLESLKDDYGFIITEAGGKLAHMSVVGREYGVTVIQVSGAMKRWEKDALVFLDLGENTLTQFIA